MKEKTSALHSEYIIDGIPKRFTPADILNGCLDREAGEASMEELYGPIVDESADPDPSTREFDLEDATRYLGQVSSLAGRRRDCPAAYPEEFTKSRIARALLDALWMKGHFRLCDLELTAKWRWNPSKMGNMAAFYASVEATADYIDSLGISLNAYSFNESDRLRDVSFKVATSRKEEGYPEDPDIEDEYLLPGNAPFGSPNPAIGRRRAVPDKLVADPDSWIIYIPFDSCGFRLGESLLVKALGLPGEAPPEIGDGDYFIDCYELVREFVEDKVILSAITVGDGGLLTALKLMCSPSAGASIDVGGIMNAYDETNSSRVLFSEVPGALIQIKDIDYDYTDAEFLLQDIAYYPLGHPVPGSGEIMVKTGRGGGIADILSALLAGQASEGED